MREFDLRRYLEASEERLSLASPKHDVVPALNYLGDLTYRSEQRPQRCNHGVPRDLDTYATAYVRHDFTRHFATQRKPNSCPHRKGAAYACSAKKRAVFGVEVSNAWRSAVVAKQLKVHPR